MDTMHAEMPTLRLVPGTGPNRLSRSARISLRGSVTRLTAGDRRIALALHAAQSAASSSVSTDSRPGGLETRPRTLEEIVVMEQRRGWNHVFKTLKSQGLLEEQTLGHVVARWARGGALGGTVRQPF
jgi:hypothetical protein